ncbi:MAG: SUMF1/EgtB/PvdO family nonheme iron enzyme [Phycisphaerae bacterium]|nr:SUMF1/EgtB/PvdO family nonheme iron enzyme [Phycisphaerae bacterium]
MPKSKHIGARGPVRILHLSDFHFTKKTDWDRIPVLQDLIRAVRELVDQGLPPDLVAITGDVAFSGKPPEYAAAQDWLTTRLLAQALPKPFPKNRILIVPGNHDVNRAAVKSSAQATQRMLLDKRDQIAIGEVLADAGERRVLLSRHANYLKFANTFRTPKQRLKVPWWSTTQDINGSRVFLAGLCSSWMSWQDDEQGRLLVSRWQVNALLSQVPRDADFRLFLLHHPWDHLAEFDSLEVQDTVRRNADLVLRGHLHTQRSATIYDPDRQSVELAAGSIYETSDHPNAFQLIELFPDRAIARVHYRLWHDGRWIIDRNAYENAQEGYADFPLQRQPTAVAEPAPDAPPPDPTGYLEALLKQTRYIDIRGLKVGSADATRLDIDRLYIPLMTTRPTEARPPKDAAKRSAKRPGKDALADLEHADTGTVDLRSVLTSRCLVIVGDPGAGKTTFLHRFAFELCRRKLGQSQGAPEFPWDALDDLLPMFIPLSALAAHMTAARERKIGPIHGDAPAWLAHFAATRGAEAANGLPETFFRDRLEAGAAVVLLDGLDDVPTEAERIALRKLIENAADHYPAARFVVTTRPAAYDGEVLLADFTETRIAPLGDPAIEDFLRTWCSILCEGDPAEADRHLKELLDPLAQRPEIRRLARNPVMLTAMAVVHWHQKRLPEQRAELYESIIDWLAKRRFHPSRLKPDRCIGVLQNLALAMQDHAKGRQVQVPGHWAARAVAPTFRDQPEDERIAAAHDFLEKEKVDSGIVVARGDHDLRFWHLTFQEYLAARALVARSDDERATRLLLADKLYHPEWREVVLLIAGVLASQGIERVDAMFETILTRITPKSKLAQKARAAGLLSAVLRDLDPVGYKPSDDRYDRLLDDAMAVFDPKKSKTIPIKDAIEAADAIAQAGDPRFADPNSDDLWVTIPACEFWMGSQNKDPKAPNYDPNAYDWEAPVHRVRLSAYRIGRYPVTVAQFERFVEAGGYKAKQFWHEGGFGDFERPDDWDDQLVYPTHPVVSVSWYEASAYARWAGCRLPTEAQWERAARGPHGRGYPWGDDKPNDRLLNFAEGNVGHPTPVGVYPLGASAEGALDLAGNVWEWCHDRFGDYSGKPQVDPTGPSSGDGRVLRGGSWDDNPWVCRSALRGTDATGGRDVYVGFRLAAGT